MDSGSKGINEFCKALSRSLTERNKKYSLFKVYEEILLINVK